MAKKLCNFRHSRHPFSRHFRHPCYYGENGERSLPFRHCFLAIFAIDFFRHFRHDGENDNTFFAIICRHLAMAKFIIFL